MDKDMVNLLKLCSKFRHPTLEEIESRSVILGEESLKTKLLILDMDETLIHAKFLEDHKG